MLAFQQKALAERPRPPYIPYAMAGRQASMEAQVDVADAFGSLSSGFVFSFATWLR